MPSNTANLGCGSMTIQYLVFLFNLIFFACGLILVIVGGIAQGFFKEYVTFFEGEFTTPAMGLIVLGLIIIIVSFFGCCGAKTQNVCMLNTFAFLLGLLLVGEIVASITVAAYKSDVEHMFQDKMNETMYQYGGKNESLVTSTWDDMQKNFHCCGSSNYTDWQYTEFGKDKDVPDTCCKKIKKDCGKDAIDDPKLIYTDGCLESLRASAKHNLGAIIGAAVGIAIIQVIGIWMSCCLVRAVKDNYEIL